MSKKAVVIHSGGMDSSLCLKLAIDEFGPQHVVSLSFQYDQRHGSELIQAQKIAHDWNVQWHCIQLPTLDFWLDSALINKSLFIQDQEGAIPANTMVLGRNGLMAFLAGMYAHSVKARVLFIGVIGLEEANSGYRDCSRHYMNTVESLIRQDIADDRFEIRTPLVHLNKMQTLELAHQHKVLSYLLENTVTCYEGVMKEGCGKCPACKLKNAGIRKFHLFYPDVPLPYLP